MTEQKEQPEKTPIYQDDKLIGYCTRVSLSEINEGLDVEYRYTIQGFEALEVEPAQPFKVGEYYITPDQRIYKIRGYSQDRELYTVDCFDQKKKVFGTAHVWHKDYFGKDRKATTEEIALFKRAEHFRSKGRKLNEFKHNDVVWIDEEYQVVFDMGNRLYLYNICGEVIGEQDTVSLIMTAEELETAAEVNR